VHDERLDQALRLIDPAAMTGKIDVLGALQQEFKRAYVGAHMTLGGRYHGRVPPHDVVAGQQHVRA